MRRFSLAVVALAACAGGGASRSRSASVAGGGGGGTLPSEPVQRPSSPEDAFVAALVAEINASAVGDCSVEYQSSGDGVGSGVITFHGAGSRLPPTTPGPIPEVTTHAFLRTERYRSPDDVAAVARKRRDEYEQCMRKVPPSERTRVRSIRADSCRGAFLPYLPMAHYADRFGVVRADSFAERFAVPEECKDALSKLEAQLTPYPSSE